MNSTAMDSRRRLVTCVRDEGMSLSQAAREFGVTRPTARKWLERAALVGVDGIREGSRAPKSVPGRTSAPVEAFLLAMKARFPEWGARKLCPLLLEEHGASLPERTADHILRRHGLTVPRPVKDEEAVRFERESCGALLQMDFKGTPRSMKYSVLTVLDDHSRFCLAFEPVPDKSGASVKACLWEVFGRHGLPDSMLMDNGEPWGFHHKRCPTKFEAWLMLLGVKPTHGRAYHPQTQGKVERFHRTAKLELGARFLSPSMDEARPLYREFVDRYNWVRPHDSLGGKTPGTRYATFPRPRPDTMPGHFIPEGALTRKVDGNGIFGYKGSVFHMGQGLIGQTIVLAEDELGLRVFFAGFPLTYMSELEPIRNSYGKP